MILEAQGVTRSKWSIRAYHKLWHTGTTKCTSFFGFGAYGAKWHLFFMRRTHYKIRRQEKHHRKHWSFLWVRRTGTPGRTWYSEYTISKPILYQVQVHQAGTRPYTIRYVELLPGTRVYTPRKPILEKLIFLRILTYPWRSASDIEAAVVLYHTLQDSTYKTGVYATCAYLVGRL